MIAPSLVVGLALSGQPTPPITTFLLDLTVAGAEPAVAATLQAQVAEALAARPELRVLTQREMVAVLPDEERAEALACGASLRCDPQGRLAEALYVTGAVGRVGRDHYLILTLRRGSAVEPLRRAQIHLPRVDAPQEAAQTAVGQLFAAPAARKAVQLLALQRPRFVVLDVTAAGLGEEAAATLTQLMSAELKSLAGSSVIHPDDVKKAIGVDKWISLVSGSTDSVLLRGLDDALRPHMVVTGHVGRLGETYLLSIVVLDLFEHVGSSHRLTESFRGAAEELPRALRAAVRHALGVDDRGAHGHIVVGSPVAEATVVLDGAEIGTAPVLPPREVPVGRHSVAVTGDGYYAVQTEVYVSPGETTSVWAELEPVPPALTEKPWFWAAAVGGAVAVSGAIAYAVWSTQQVPDGSGRVVWGAP